MIVCACTKTNPERPVMPDAKREAVTFLKERIRDERASGLYRDCRRPVDGPLPVAPCGRHRAAWPAAGARRQHRRFGYRRLFILLRRDGEPSGIGRVYRLNREEGLMMRKRRGRPRPWERGLRSWWRPGRTPDGRWTLSTISSPRPTLPFPQHR